MLATQTPLGPVADPTIPLERIKVAPDDVAAPRHRGGHSAVLVAASVALAAAALAAVGAAERELWNDEYATWHAATLSRQDFAKLLGNVDVVHALYYVLMHGWINLVGDSPLALRLPSIAATGLAAGALTLVGRRMFHASVGVTAGLLFAAIPAVSRYAQEARSFALVSALTVVATLLLLRALENSAWRRWILYGACIAVLGWVNFVALLVLLPHVLLFWRAAKRSHSMHVWRGLVAVVMLLAAILPLLSKAATQSGQISHIKADRTAVITLPTYLFASHQVMLVVVGAAALAVIVLWWSHRHEVLVLLSWVLVPPVFCYVTFNLLHLFLPRYLLFTLPAWALLAAALIQIVIGAMPRRRSLAGALAFCLGALLIVPVTAVGLPAQREARRSPVYGQPDYRAVALIVRAGMQPGDGIVFNDEFGERSGLARKAFRYELRDSTAPRDVFLAVPAHVRGSFSASECPAAQSSACLGATKRLWLVSASFSPDPFYGLEPVRKKLLQDEFAFAGVPHAYEGVQVSLLTRRAP